MAAFEQNKRIRDPRLYLSFHRSSRIIYFIFLFLLYYIITRQLTYIHRVGVAFLFLIFKTVIHLGEEKTITVKRKSLFKITNLFYDNKLKIIINNNNNN